MSTPKNTLPITTETLTPEQIRAREDAIDIKAARKARNEKAIPWSKVKKELAKKRRER